MNKGIFITLEGGEGAGKSTQAARIKSYFEETGRMVTLTREPGGTAEAEKIRDLLVQRDGGRWTPIAECALFFAARQMHIEHLIKPALNDGHVVISDRFTDSTRAYQGYGHGFDLEKIEQLNDLIVGGFAPDLTFIFDLPIEEGLKRSLLQKNKSLGREATEGRFENLNHEFHEKLRQGYLQIAEANPQRCHVLDAAQAPDQVFAALKEVLNSHVV